MITTLVITLVIEGIAAIFYSHWRHKPMMRIALMVSLTNLLTQPLLWLAVTIFYRAYLPILLLSELGIWLVEAAFLRLAPTNRLAWDEAFALSLGMNLASFGIGWFLPV